jgi:hypothetical protein
MHKGSPLPPLCDHNHRRRHSRTIPPQRLSVVRDPQENNHRPRPPIYLALRYCPVPKTENQAEHIDSLPPTNRRIIGEEEPVGRTVPPIHHNSPTRRLERLAPNRLPRAQHLDQRHHQDCPNPSIDQLPPRNKARINTPINQSKGRRTRGGDKQTKGTSEDSTGPSRPRNADRTISDWRPSLAGSKAPSPPLSSAQVSP